jgi:hypothetical protein
VAVPRNDTSALEDAPEVLLDLLGRRVVADGLLQTEEELEGLLVGKTMERAGKTAESSRVGKEGVREGRADKVCAKARKGGQRRRLNARLRDDATGSVGRDVAALVVGVESVVQSDDLDEALRLAKADLLGVVPRQVLVLVDGGQVLGATEVLVGVDA